MSETYSQFYNPQSGSELTLTKPYPDHAYNNLDCTKQSFEDHFGSTTENIVAPHAEEFELDLDTSFADIGELPLSYNPIDAFDIAYFRSETPRRGLGSTFTVSSESTSVYGSNYETNSYYSGYSPSSQYSNNYPVVVEDLGALDMDLQRMGILSQDTSALSAMHAANPDLSPGSINLSSLSPASFSSRSSFSDYEPSNQIRVGSSATSDYYPQSADRYPTVPIQATVSPANVTSQLPVVSSQSSPHSHSSSRSESGATSDPKRKYQCPSCPRAFARAFNLKTHIQTHDPNRAKPYVCSVKSCGRSFSRKHDLMRHNVSIHRTEGSPSAPSVGVERGQRTRCEQCGKSWVGQNNSDECDCIDVK